jgi:hypothetical protein
MPMPKLQQLQFNPRASSDTVESERRQMKQCWIKYKLNKFSPSPPYVRNVPLPFSLCSPLLQPPSPPPGKGQNYGFQRPVVFQFGMVAIGGFAAEPPPPVSPFSPQPVFCKIWIWVRHTHTHKLCGTDIFFRQQRGVRDFAEPILVVRDDVKIVRKS